MLLWRGASVDASDKEEHMRCSRRMIGGASWPRADVVLLGALVLTGCASALVIRVPKAGPETACITPAPDREVLVGVALSGGGSRAALFGAAGLEALGRLQAPGGGSVLEQVAYLSSVSGGSVAAAYYASQKPPQEIPVLTPEGALTADYQTFFAEYQEKLRQDFEGALLRRQLLSFRWLNSSLAARSLAEVMAERLLGPTTLGDLARREARGDSPRLIINTTLYNSGRRFVLTTLPPEAARYDFYSDLRAALARRGQTAEFPPAFLQRWEKLLSVTPLELGIDPCPIRRPGSAPARISPGACRPARPTASRGVSGLNLAKVETTARSPGGRLHQWPTRVYRVPTEECIAASTASLLYSGDGKTLTLLLLPHRGSWFCTAMQTVNLVDGVVLGQNLGLR
jgi:hypothetical protein